VKKLTTISTGHDEQNHLERLGLYKDLMKVEKSAEDFKQQETRPEISSKLKHYKEIYSGAKRRLLQLEVDNIAATATQNAGEEEQQTLTPAQLTKAIISTTYQVRGFIPLSNFP
jgi:hypothetical protein